VHCTHRSGVEKQEGLRFAGSRFPVLSSGLEETVRREKVVVQKLRVELYCDRCADDVQAERTMGFGVDDEAGNRREYKIELCNMHLKEFVTDLEPWIAGARSEEKSVGRGRRGSPTSARPTGMNGKTNTGPARRDPEQLAGIRAWARANGFEVSDKGRIPAEVEQAYNRQAQTVS